MLAVLDAILDGINAVAKPKADAKRLIAAKKKYKDADLVGAKLGKQKFLIAEPVLDQLIECGLWALLQQAAERGNQLNSVMDS